MEQVLNQLPRGWVAVQIKDVTKSLSSGFACNKSFETTDGYVHLRTHNVSTNGRLNLDQMVKVSYDKIDEKKSKIFKGEILFNNTNSKELVGKTAYIDKDYDFAFSNHLTRIIPNDKIYSKFLVYWLVSLQTSGYFNQICKKWIGQAGVNNTVLKDISVPLPDKEEQKRIVEKLDALLTRIDTAIEHLQQSVTLADALYASELASVFTSGQDKWALKKLNEVAEVARGKSKHRPRNDKSLFGGDYPFIQTGDVRSAQKYITNFSATYNEKGLQQSKLWPKDTICLTIAANIGDVAILGMDACFPDSVVGISSTELETDYLYYFLTTLQQQLDNKANAAAQKNINLKILSEIKIPVPTLDEQKNIVRQINKIDQLAVKVKVEISEKITMMRQLKASILDSAFKGGL